MWMSSCDFWKTIWVRWWSQQNHHKSIHCTHHQSRRPSWTKSACRTHTRWSQWMWVQILTKCPLAQARPSIWSYLISHTLLHPPVCSRILSSMCPRTRCLASSGNHSSKCKYANNTKIVVGWDLSLSGLSGCSRWSTARLWGPGWISWKVGLSRSFSCCKRIAWGSQPVRPKG